MAARAIGAATPRKSIADIIALQLLFHGIGFSWGQTRAVREMFDAVGLPTRVMNGYPSPMSGGQRQRVAIAVR